MPLPQRVESRLWRAVAERIARQLPRRHFLEAYARGVNAGLSELGAAPFEYLLLRTSPEAWRPEDSVLVVLAMFMDLQPAFGSRESASGLVHDLLPAPLAVFMDARGSGMA